MAEDPTSVFSERAAWYATSPVHRDPEALERLVAWAAPRAPDRVLDVGTGTGHTALAFAPHVASVLGLDPTPAMLDHARAEAARRGLGNVTFVVGRAEALPLAPASCSLVTCRRAAHHVADLPRALAEVRRVLAPGGRFLLDDRSVPDDPELDRLQNELDTLHDPSHVREHPPHAWRTLLAAAGLRVVRLEPYDTLRPFDAFCAAARPADADAMRRTARAWSPAIRLGMGANPDGDVVVSRHWFLTVLAVRDDDPV